MKYFLRSALLAYAVNSSNSDFVRFVDGATDLPYNFADYFVYTLPAPRSQFYKHSSLSKTIPAVNKQIASVQDSLGYFPVYAN